MGPAVAAHPVSRRAQGVIVALLVKIVRSMKGNVAAGKAHSLPQPQPGASCDLTVRPRQ
jgi:hypothetical protein